MESAKLEELKKNIGQLQDKGVEVSVVLNADFTQQFEWLEIGEASCRAKIRMDYNNPDECKLKLATIAELRNIAVSNGVVKEKEKEKNGKYQ